MRPVWTLGIWLVGAAGLVLMAIGATYLGVTAGGLPAVLGKVPGSSAHFTERGLFGVMVGGVLGLVAISLHQFRPGGALAPVKDSPTDGPTDGPAPQPPSGVDAD